MFWWTIVQYKIKENKKMKLVVSLLRKKFVLVIRRRMTKHNPSQQILDCYIFIGKRFIMAGTGNTVVFILSQTLMINQWRNHTNWSTWWTWCDARWTCLQIVYRHSILVAIDVVRLIFSFNMKWQQRVPMMTAWINNALTVDLRYTLLVLAS